jgi:AcrR family transcriptional regulator
MVKAKITKRTLKTPALSTEEKIKEAARKVFTKKGFAATRTRDIAEEAGINLALLNYYFRSKEKLFEIIIREKLQKFFGFIGPIINNESTTLDAKIDGIVFKYFELLLDNPDIPFFVLGEARNNPEVISNAMPQKDFIKNSFFIKQVHERKPDQDPYQFLLSMLGMIIFPFIMRPVFQRLTQTDDAKTMKMLVERRALIPVWCKALLKVK